MKVVVALAFTIACLAKAEPQPGVKYYEYIALGTSSPNRVTWGEARDICREEWKGDLLSMLTQQKQGVREMIKKAIEEQTFAGRPFPKVEPPYEAYLGFYARETPAISGDQIARVDGGHMDDFLWSFLFRGHDVDFPAGKSRVAMDMEGKPRAYGEDERALMLFACGTDIDPWTKG